jgi:hypothetical protein
MRNYIALGICLASALGLGVWCLFGRSPVSTLTDLWVIWFAVALWLDGWRKLDRTPREIYEAAQLGELQMHGLALGIKRASFVWLAAAGVIYFVG